MSTGSAGLARARTWSVKLRMMSGAGFHLETGAQHAHAPRNPALGASTPAGPERQSVVNANLEVKVPVSGLLAVCCPTTSIGPASTWTYKRHNEYRSAIGSRDLHCDDSSLRLVLERTVSRRDERRIASSSPFSWPRYGTPRRPAGLRMDAGADARFAGANAPSAVRSVGAAADEPFTTSPPRCVEFTPVAQGRSWAGRSGMGGGMNGHCCQVGDDVSGTWFGRSMLESSAAAMSSWR